MSESVCALVAAAVAVGAVREWTGGWAGGWMGGWWWWWWGAGGEEGGGGCRTSTALVLVAFVGVFPATLAAILSLVRGAPKIYTYIYKLIF